MNPPQQAPVQITAGFKSDNEGKPIAFILSRGNESISLDPGKTWIKADTFKWVSRGLIEEPQSFHVMADGSVEINGEKIRLQAPQGIIQLEQEINKSHKLDASSQRPIGLPGIQKTKIPIYDSHKILFRVRIDALGHLLIEAHRGHERIETGLRGLAGFIHNGLMRKPTDLHVDPLQRHVEIDHFRFDCSKEGAQRLEELLNAKYAPSLDESSNNSIEIRDNAASATGFDIQFITNNAGFRNEIKGHLNQEKLDILQDSAKCDILRPGVLLRFSPPHLLIRMRRSDGGEDHIPELPDIQYRHTTAAELQRILNHPLLRKTRGHESQCVPIQQSAVLVASLAITKDSININTLWLDYYSTQGELVERKAFTHHNILEMTHHGIFADDYDVAVSFDNRILTVTNKSTHQSKSMSVRPDSNEEHLKEASRWLTSALKLPSANPIPQSHEKPISIVEAPRKNPEISQPFPPPSAQKSPDSASVIISEMAVFALPSEKLTPLDRSSMKIDASRNSEVLEKTTTIAPKNVTESEVAASQITQSTLDPAVLEAFKNSDPLQTIFAVYNQLQDHLDIPSQTMYLSMPRMFENRRFDVINIYQIEIESVLDLRSEAFCGFYLSFITDHNVILVYACQGRHIEWGPSRCLIESSIASDPEEYSGAGLLGFGLNQNGHCVFIVQPTYRQWIRDREKHCQNMNIHFLTVEELAANSSEISLLWPQIFKFPT